MKWTRGSQSNFTTFKVPKVILINLNNYDFLATSFFFSVGRYTNTSC